MKKERRFALLMIVSLVLSGCGKEVAAAVEATKRAGTELLVARETLSPATEIYVSEEELNTVGACAYYPNMNREAHALAGSNCLTLYFKNENVLPQAGQVALFEKDTQKKVAAFDVFDEESVVVSAVGVPSADLSGDTFGTQVDLYFDYAFEPGKTYFVLMDAGCFALGRVKSKAVTDAEMINFTTKSYGFAGVMRSVYHTQDFAFFDIVLGEADTAKISCNEEEMSVVHTQILKEEVSENGKFFEKPLVTFLRQGRHTLTVHFYRGEEQIDAVDVTFEVVPPDVPIEGEESLTKEGSEENKEEREEG